MSEKIDLTGQRRGRWLVLEDAGHDKNGNALWKCRCSCPLGTERVVLGKRLRNGSSRSCGCLHREEFIERKTTHGLYKSNPRLIGSIYTHFRRLGEGVDGYQRWILDPRYPDNAEGVAMFCMDAIALYPEACALYEVDKSLDLDKDNDIERIFRPECIVFRPRSENRSRQSDNLKLDDGTSLAMFCRKVGIQMRENGKKTKVYDRICHMYSNYHKPHPELLKKANDLILLYKKTLDLLKLQEEVRRFASEVQKLP